MKKPSIYREESGATTVELAFAFPVFIVMVWMMVQAGLIFRANSGIQHALGQGARFATLYPTPNDTQIDTAMNDAVYGIGPGTFATTVTDVPADGYKDLRVTYTQPTDLLLFKGPTISVTKFKRVWIAGGLRTASGSTPGSTLPTGTPSSPTSPTTPTTPTEPTTPTTPTTPTPSPTPSPTPEVTPTPTPTPSPTPTPGNGNGNGNIKCTKSNGKAC